MFAPARQQSPSTGTREAQAEPAAGTRPRHAKRGGGSAPFDFSRLAITHPGDPSERQADAAAHTIASGETPVFRTPQGPPRHSGVVANGLARAIEARAGEGAALPVPMQHEMERTFGADFSSVRIHTDVHAEQFSRRLNAQAFTLGPDIYFNRGRYAPDTAAGGHLLSHELAHVAQQGNGVQRTIQRTVDNVTIDCSLEEIAFQHDGTTTSYHLDHCDVTDGAYDASVTLGSDTVDFDLGEVPAETRFDFRYSIAPGQPNPNTFFRGQARVPIRCTSGGGLSPLDGEYHFNVDRMTFEQYEQFTGQPAASLPESRIVPVSAAEPAAGPQQSSRPGILAPAGVGASMTAPTGLTFIPRNATGILWSGHHASVLATPESAFFPTIRGYRGNLGHYLLEAFRSSDATPRSGCTKASRGCSRTTPSSQSARASRPISMWSGAPTTRPRLRRA